jgi:hypothetical protein
LFLLSLFLLMSLILSSRETGTQIHKTQTIVWAIKREKKGSQNDICTPHTYTHVIFSAIPILRRHFLPEWNSLPTKQ